ncbi:MAG TPA: hypothetical protein VM165_00385, partial [Planctomycetaceae bacterium]|nr:hypothetical protein [Planctomycetaceae bacterium]
YLRVLADLAARGLGGGVIYDALIAAAADIAGVDFLVTRNVKHFELVWPQGCGRIVSPDIVAAP